MKPKKVPQNVGVGDVVLQRVESGLTVE